LVEKLYVLRMSFFFGFLVISNRKRIVFERIVFERIVFERIGVCPKFFRGMGRGRQRERGGFG